MRVTCILLFAAVATPAAGGNPALRAWLVNPTARTASTAGLRSVLPHVHQVRVEGTYAVVESAGLSLQSLGPLEANGWEPPVTPRKFTFRIPLEPKPANRCSNAPLGVIGALVNGVPLYNPISGVSYRDQNLWHLDAVAAYRRESSGSLRSPLLDSLLQSSNRHSPLIGFALDGYPIYGPFGWDDRANIRRFRSSYRLRAIGKRSAAPGGTDLTPAQEGPPVSAEFPLGTFAEDYEFVPGSGDLDAHNGRFAKTPEYPEGTYAYFLATDPQGAMEYPYLVGSTYHGEVETRASEGGMTIPPLESKDLGRIQLRTSTAPAAGRPESLTFSIRGPHGQSIRFLEKVHERPIHLLVVSTDLSEFAHIHPELQQDESYSVSHVFPHGGSYWLFVDHTRPGESQTVSRFHVEIAGPARAAVPLRADANFTKSQDGLRVTMTPPARLQTGADLTFRFDVADAAGNPVSNLQPYLGAWAHIMVVSENREDFIHAHPLDDAATTADNSPWLHSHAAPGPSPSSVTTVTGFRRPGLYRLWVQFQQDGKVITVPYTFQVEPASRKLTAGALPKDAIAIEVTSAGFEPARISAPAGKLIRLAFHRPDAQNCASSVAFPALNLRRDLPAGQTTVVEIPASVARELTFACGMNMYRGSLVIR